MNAVLTLERRDLLRRATLERRNLLSKAEVCIWSEQIQARALALDCYRAADAIALYSPIQNEVDTGRLLDHALASGKRVYLPRWLGQDYGFGQIASRWYEKIDYQHRYVTEDIGCGLAFLVSVADYIGADIPIARLTPHSCRSRRRKRFYENREDPSIARPFATLG